MYKENEHVQYQLKKKKLGSVYAVAVRSGKEEKEKRTTQDKDK